MLKVCFSVNVIFVSDDTGNFLISALYDTNYRKKVSGTVVSKGVERSTGYKPRQKYNRNDLPEKNSYLLGVKHILPTKCNSGTF